MSRLLPLAICMVLGCALVACSSNDAGNQASGGVVTYESDSNGLGGVVERIYLDGEGKSRDEYVGEGDESMLISIVTPDQYYDCDMDLWGGCLTGPADSGVRFSGDPLNDEYSFVSLAGSDCRSINSCIDALHDADVSSYTEEIAGVQADCGRAVGDVISYIHASIEWCVFDKFVMGWSEEVVENGQPSQREVRATEFTTEVPDDAFDPPFEVVTMAPIDPLEREEGE